MTGNLFIRGARVLTFDETRRDLDCADILIERGMISAVGPDLVAPEGVPVIDGAGQLAMPGLINAHFHSPANLMKGMLDSLPLEIFMLYEVPPLSDVPPPPELVRVRTLLGAVEMLKRGITSVQDDAFFVPGPDPDAIDALMGAYAASGMRATVALDQPNVVEYAKYPFLADLLPAGEKARMEAAPRQTGAELLDLYRHLLTRWSGAKDGRLGAAVSCSAPHRVTQDYMAALSQLSREWDVPFYVHMLETRVQRVFGQEVLGKSLVRYIHDLGMLDERVNLIHGIWLDEPDMDLIADAGACIAHNPVCNLRLGSGIMPFRALSDRNIPICLGTDEALADDGINLWGAIKTAGLVHNITDPDYRRWPTAQEILDCAFLGGARAMRRQQTIGRIMPGYAADIAMLDLSQINFTPLNDLARQLVYCEDGGSVRRTIVAGRVVMEDGKVRGIDEAELFAQARELAREHAPALETARAAAARLEPHYRDMYLRASRTDVGFTRWLEKGTHP
ncbi:amidohydrolase family protein [Fluviibacterium sp. DFM31]|uniref:Amidohydrolase family protein n=1 Tax=Meridianimarinicoccus marinus TaxID=3231483 RepID=A0ABV3L7V0_9RHOB